VIRKILLVDNDQILQLTLSRMLAKFDEEFQVVQAVDGFDALKKLEKAAFSLICTELMMPRMDGISLINHVRTKYPDIPVIVISGMKKSDIPDIEQVQQMVAYLEKPFRETELLELIRTVLRKEAKEGIMNNVSPTMFLQLMEMEGKTCTIRMLDNGSEEGGILYLRDGQLLDARVGKLKGLEAASRVFFWDDVTVFLRYECPSRENVINSAIQTIIMAALVAKDEHTDSTTAARGAANQNSEGAEKLSLDELKEFIIQELGGMSGVGAIAGESSMIAVNSKLVTLGKSAEFGAFKAAYIEGQDGRSALLVPGNPPARMDVTSECPVEELLRKLKERA